MDDAFSVVARKPECTYNMKIKYLLDTKNLNASLIGQRHCSAQRCCLWCDLTKTFVAVMLKSSSRQNQHSVCTIVQVRDTLLVTSALAIKQPGNMSDPNCVEPACASKVDMFKSFVGKKKAGAQPKSPPPDCPLGREELGTATWGLVRHKNGPQMASN